MIKTKAQNKKKKLLKFNTNTPRRNERIKLVTKRPG